MKLLVDIGNTRIKWALARDHALLESGAFSYEEIEVFLSRRVSNIELLMLANVTSAGKPQIVEKISTWCQKNDVLLQHARVQKECVGLTVAYEELKNLGVDRWLAMVGAWQLHRCACVVIDSGSAITVDYLDNAGVHLGGLIVPGKNLLRKTLFDNTSAVKVPESELPRQWRPGVDTKPCVTNGLAAMLKGFVCEALAHTKLLPGMECGKIVLTGGDAQLLGNMISDAQLGENHGFELEITPQLVLHGLHCVS
ncbi:MAG: type III pantothenate kinase [Agarilytica sp.]